jgi:hypothetical protein
MHFAHASFSINTRGRAQWRSHMKTFLKGFSVSAILELM